MQIYYDYNLEENRKPIRFCKNRQTHCTKSTNERKDFETLCGIYGLRQIVLYLIQQKKEVLSYE